MTTVTPLAERRTTLEQSLADVSRVLACRPLPDDGTAVRSR